MADAKQLSILEQGVDVWNKWRDENPFVGIDLEGADLSGASLNGVNLMNANLEEVKLREAFLGEANLSGANLIRAHLDGAHLGSANLSYAHLFHADLREARLNVADLTGADLREAYLRETSLRGADLSRVKLNKAHLNQTDLYRARLIGADLRETILSEVNLIESELSEAKIASTIFAKSDLTEIIGLQDVVHSGPSSISFETLALSNGKIPKIFLRGCGLSDADIEYVKLSKSELSNEEIDKILYTIHDLRATQAFQISPLFISYSHADGAFVNKIGNTLTQKGVRYWRDIHEMKAGRIERQIDRGIRQNPTVLLVLSENSIKSDWVEHEVRTARDLEKEVGRDILCPVALDDSWKDSNWPKRVMEQIMEYNILDFSAWKDDAKFEGMFRKLIDGLELFYKDTSHGE